MRIIKRTADNVVIFAEPDLTLSPEGASGAGWVSNSVTSEDHVLEEIAALPKDFIGLGYSCVNGVMTINDCGTAHALKQADLEADKAAQQVKADALNAILKSDLVALRCFKAGVPYPADWKAHDGKLRGLINGGTGQLPELPAYPAGT